MASHRPVTLALKDVDKHDLGIVGVKSVSFAEMMSEGLPVPDGFSITLEGYDRFIEENDLDEEIKGLLTDINLDNPEELLQTSELIQKRITHSKMPEYVSGDIVKQYKKISPRFGSAVVLVRSAHIGSEQTNFFNVKGETRLLESIKRSWASHFTAHAISQKQEIRPIVVVQKMLEPEVSGVIYSVDPIYADNNTIVIESVWGLNEVIGLGIVVPDTYAVKKNGFTIVSKEVSEQKRQIVSKGERVKQTKVSRRKQNKQKIPDKDVVKLAEYANKLQEHYYFPQEIRWAKQGKDLYITQARQVTSINRMSKHTQSTEDEFMYNDTPVVKGTPASEGQAKGKISLISSNREIKKLKKGDVLVTKMTNPHYLEAIKKASAIVTDEGGLHSHAATIAREFSIPCIVGAKNSTEKLHDGYAATVDATRGLVYLGSRVRKEKTKELDGRFANTKTATNIFIELDSTSSLSELSQYKCEGVITSNMQDIHEICKIFSSKQVIYRATEGFFELEDFVQAREKHKNLSLMVSRTHSVESLRNLRRKAATAGLFSNNFEFWLQADFPVNIIELKDFISVGVDGVHVGSDSLSVLILGKDEIDRFSQSMLWAIERVAKITAEMKVKSSVGGYMPTHYEEALEKSLKYGITNISVSPKVLERVKSVIVRVEKQTMK